MSYTPPQGILDKYASVLVNFALGGGTGIAAGDVVRVAAPESARPLFAALHRAIWRAGGHVLTAYATDADDQVNLQREFFEVATPEQIEHFAGRYYRGLVDEMDHQVTLLAESDPHALDGVDPSLIMRRGVALHPLIEWRTDKENAGDFSWTLCLYGTEKMAAEAGMSLEDYWEQIIHACFLDHDDPIARWREVGERIDRTVAWLDGLKIDSVHVLGEDVDLRVRVGEHRRWLGGRGRNVPSFEVFTSPDWRGTDGWIYCNQPLYRYGSLVRGVRLEFADGRVVKASAEENERLLADMIAVENADKIGEFSLTDRRLSRITRFMAHTLFDENAGGEFGNTHVAVGRAYQDAYDGDPTTVAADEWDRLGFNTSSVHTDVVSTSDRTVTATLADGSERLIYERGEFQLD